MFLLKYESYCAHCHKAHVSSVTFCKILRYQFHKMQQMVYSLKRGHVHTDVLTTGHSLLSSLRTKTDTWNKNLSALY